MRGEYCLFVVEERLESELPPRARRIQSPQVNIPVGNGTTSACAENTVRRQVPLGNDGNYLRVRGEYVSQLREAREIMELPPRARRIQWVEAQVLLHEGTTSACAENTPEPEK